MAVNISLTDITNLQNENTAVAALNANSAAITTAFEEVLSRDGTSPNAMEAQLDMNSHRIINLGAPANLNDAARMQDVQNSEVKDFNNATLDAAFGTTPGTVVERGLVFWEGHTKGEYDVSIYGAVPDFHQSNQIYSVATTNRIIASGEPWVITDVGSLFVMNGAGAAGGVLYATITSFINSNTINISVTASTTVNAGYAQWGKDNTAAFNAAFAACKAGGGGTVFVPTPNVYCVTSLNFTEGSYVKFKGVSGVNTSRLMPMLNSNCVIDASGSSLTMENIGVGNNNSVGAVPVFGLVHSITDGTPGIDFIAHTNVFWVGCYSGAAFYLDRISSSSMRKCSFINYYQGGTPGNSAAGIFTANNLLNFSSAFTTTNVGASNTSDFSFLGCEFHSIDPGNSVSAHPALILDAVQQIQFFGGNMASSHAYIIKIVNTNQNILWNGVTFYSDTGPSATNIIGGAGTLNTSMMNCCYYGSISSANIIANTVTLGSFRQEPFSVVNHGVIIGTVEGQLNSTAASVPGTLFHGTSGDPSFTASPTLGVQGTTQGVLTVAATSGASGQIVLTAPDNTQVSVGHVGGATYPFYMPSSVGTAGQPLLSGGGVTLQSYGTLAVPAGGTGLTAGTSGGVPFFNSTSTMTSGNALGANQLVIGGGVGGGPSSIGSTGTTTTVLHGNASGSPTFGAITSGDITANAISNSLLRQSSAISLVGNATGSTANVADVTASSANQVMVVNSGGSGLGWGQVNLASTNAVTGTLAAAQFPALTGAIATTAGSLTTSFNAASQATLRTLGAEILGEVTGINSQSASYTVVLADKGKTVEVSNASANTLTIPPNSSVAFPVDTYLNVVQMGAGQTTLTPGAGVVLRNRSGLKLAGQYAVATLYQRATNEWVCGGDLTA